MSSTGERVRIYRSAAALLLCVLAACIVRGADSPQPSQLAPPAPESAVGPFFTPTNKQSRPKGAISVSVSSREMVRNLYNTVYTA